MPCRLTGMPRTSFVKGSVSAHSRRARLPTKRLYSSTINATISSKWIKPLGHSFFHLPNAISMILSMELKSSFLENVRPIV